MKAQTTQEPVVISADEIEALKAAINLKWDDFYTAEELAAHIEHGFIFGTYASNKHYLKEFILQLIGEVEAEKNPVVIEEEVPFFESLDPIVTPE